MNSTLDMHLFLNQWMFMPEIWIILGILLIVSDLLIGMTYILIPFGVASLFTAAFVKFNNSEFLFELSFENETIYRYLNLESWQEVLYCFAILSIISVLLLRLLTSKKSGEDDINQY